MPKGLKALPVLVLFLALGWVFRAAAHHDEGGSPLFLVEGGVAPGEDFWLAYHPLTPEGAFFTFWAEGHEAPQIDWQLPEGFTLGETRWPQFERFEGKTGPVFGFAAGSVIYQQIKVPEDWRPAPFDVGVNVSYFVCLDGCNPIFEQGTADLDPASPPDARGALPATDFDLGRLVIHVNAGTNDDFTIGVNFRHDDRTADVEAVWFLPVTEGLLPEGPPFQVRPAVQQFYNDSFHGYISGAPMAAGAGEIERIHGLVLLEMKDGTAIRQHAFSRDNDYRDIVALGELAAEPAAPEFTLLTAFLFALLGGVILNIMPCVLPVLAMKVFSFMKAGSLSPGKLRADGLAYTAGIVLSFALVGGVLMAFRAGGDVIGWGFQLQQPAFVFAVILLLFAVGLNFLGLFEVSAGRLSGLGQKMTEKEGPAGAFFTGVLATVVATPCTAPFMASALAFGLSQSVATGFTVFVALGLGLALPYLLLSFVPALGKFLPKPGPWMNTFKQFLAFPIFATVVWLLWILNIQTGANGLLVALSALLAIALAVWLARIVKKPALKTAFVAFLVIASLSPLAMAGKLLPASDSNAALTNSRVEVMDYDAEALAMLRAEGTPVFLHFWAAWCPVCILHEEFVFLTDDFQDFVRREGIVFMVIDNTTSSPEKWALIESFGRKGQSIDVFYPPGEDPVVLPELYNTGYLLARLEQELE